MGNWGFFTPYFPLNPWLFKNGILILWLLNKSPYNWIVESPTLNNQHNQVEG